MRSVPSPPDSEAPIGAELCVVGVSHRTAPLELIEQTTVGDSDLAQALHALLDCDRVTEAVVLSTCMRTEIYAVTDRSRSAASEMRNVLAAWSGRGPDQLDDHFYCFDGNGAVSHLFRVTSGIDSAILGEGEIVRQVRQAWERAREENAVGPILGRLFRHALEVGKRARSETSISRGTTSLAQAAVSMAVERLGSLEGKTILVVGAGEMGEAMAQRLASARGTGEILVANRTWSKAVALAERFGGKPLELGGLATAVERADLLLTSTGAATLLVEADDLGIAARAGRPLLVVDLAVPRDVDPAVGDLPGITVLNIDDLKAFFQSGMSERRRQIEVVETIVANETHRFAELAAQREVAPVIAALRDRAEHLRRAELDRYRVQLSGLGEQERAHVEALTRGLLAKLLHEPSIQLKARAGSLRPDPLAQATRVLFGL